MNIPYSLEFNLSFSLQKILMIEMFYEIIVEKECATFKFKGIFRRQFIYRRKFALVLHVIGK